jgi:hypothetical protein
MWRKKWPTQLSAPLPQTASALSLVSDLPRLLALELLVTDSDSIAELLQHDEGDRNAIRRVRYE